MDLKDPDHGNRILGHRKRVMMCIRLNSQVVDVPICITERLLTSKPYGIMSFTKDKVQRSVPGSLLVDGDPNSLISCG
jgi:hypothetical protein